METRQPTGEELERFASQLAFLLRAYHDACDKDPVSRETEFWRGNISGLRIGIEAFYGNAQAVETVLDRLQQITGLKIP
jgi:hypothetical protein